jgi:hypothetical protein
MDMRLNSQQRQLAGARVLHRLGVESADKLTKYVHEDNCFPLLRLYRHLLFMHLCLAKSVRDKRPDKIIDCFDPCH